MKNFLAIITLLLLALAGLGSSAPQGIKIPTINFEPTGTSGSTDPSPDCLKAITGLLSDPNLNKCLPVPAILALIKDPTILQKVAADPLHNLPLLGPTFDAVCALPKCSDDLVGTVIKTVKDSCQKDIQAKIPLVLAVLDGAIIYSPLRDSVCFKDPQKEYCLFETVGILAKLPASPIPILHNTLADSVAVASPNLICTPCNKAVVNTIFNYYKGNHPDFVALLGSFGIDQGQVGLYNVAVDIKCGLPFNDGNVGDPTIPPKCP